MPEIKFRLEGGEPVCMGVDGSCPWYESICADVTSRDPVTGYLCIPGLRQQRDRARAKLQTIRTLIDEEEWNSDFRDVLLAELGGGK